MKQKLILSLFFSSVIALSSCTAPVKVTLEFDSNGGTTIAPLTLDHGETITIPSNPSKEGFNFGGWYWDNNVFQDPFTINSIWDRPIVDRYVVFAKWATDDSVVLPGSLTITFNSNGGTPVSSVNVQKGNTVSIPATTRTGYTLDGWYTSLNGGVTLDERWSFTSNVVNNNITLYAKWNINQYSITFDSEGGSLVNSITQDFDSNINSPQEPTKLGYSFSGWNQAIPTTMPASNITITATWSINSYTLIYKDFDNSNLFSENFLFNSDLSAVTIIDPVRVGYTFIGWSQVLPTNMPASNLTIYANYRINLYTLTLDTNGGTSISTLTLNYGSAINLSTTLKTGHSFQGWFTDIGLTQAFTLSTMPASNLSLYAKWMVNQYTITFETNGGSSIAPIPGNFGDSVSVPNDPTREGYTFSGWYTDVNLTQATTVPNAIPAQNLTLYASWIINQYTITFETNGGNAVQTRTHNFNSYLFIIPNTSRVGHTFAGWYTDVSLTQTFTMITMPASNLTLYAKWTINQYTITFETNGGSSIAPIPGNFGDSVSVPNDPTREGYTFSGWYTDVNLTQATTVPNAIPAQNLTLYAKWTVLPDISFTYLGASHTSSLSSNGRVFIWGDNNYGQLGDGTNSDQNVPTEITSRFSLFEGDKIIELSLGFQHSSALSLTGRVFMWGYNQNGQLGDGTNSNRNVPTEITSRFSLAQGDKIIGLSLGRRDHSSAVSLTGRVFMWGRNYYGNLGNATTNYRNIPTEITSRFSLVEGDKVIGISLGDDHSSALSLTGRVFTWGRNRYGQLGDGAILGSLTSIDRNVPTEITSRFSLIEGDKIIEISLGFEHSSAVSLTGRVFTWGYNYKGRLGDGTFSTRNVPTEITSRFLLVEGDKISGLSLGENYSSAVSFTGRVFTWGDNQYGQLGNGTAGGFTYLNVPTEITSRFSLAEGDKIVSLSLGICHSSAVSSKGKVYMWGNNIFSGGLGDGTRIDSYIPKLI
jgi:uncharacterized repeat protein (TIGR02543 family)